MKNKIFKQNLKEKSPRWGTLRKEGAPKGFSISIKYCCVNTA